MDVITLQSAKTQGDRRYARLSAFAPLKRTLAAGKDTHICIVGDSTGNETTEWVYLFAQYIASLNANYNVNYSLWDGTRYGALTQLQTASGGRGKFTIGAGATNFPSLYPGVRTSADLDVAVRMKPAGAWTDTPSGAGNASFVSQLGSAGSRVFDFWQPHGSNPSFLLYPDGTNAASQFTVNAPLTLTAATEGWVRCTVDVDDGAGGAVGKAYQSTDGYTWTQVGATITKVGTQSIYTGASPRYEIGGRNGGNPWTGAEFYEAVVRDGIDGPIIMATNAHEWTEQASSLAVKSGGPTLTIWNASYPGASISYLGDAARLPLMVPLVEPSLVMLSTSHNEQFLQGAQWRALYFAWIADIRVRAPLAPVMMMTQNPRIAPSPAPEHATRCADIMNWRSGNIDAVDTYSAFVNDPRGLATLINADGVHPDLTGGGRQLWTDTVKAAYDAA